MEIPARQRRLCHVAVVPGLYYAVDSAKAGDTVVAPKQEGAQGFYKVWVSDAPIAAE